MKKFISMSALVLALAACQKQQPAPTNYAPLPQTPPATFNPETSGTAQTPTEVEQNVGADPITVSDASGVVGSSAGSTCLAAKVLTNEGAFLDAGTAGELSGDVFTTGGNSYDLSGIGYSTKPC